MQDVAVNAKIPSRALGISEPEMMDCVPAKYEKQSGYGFSHEQLSSWALL